MDKIHLYQEDSKFDNLLEWLNRIALLSCWLAVIGDIIFLAITGQTGLALIFAMYTPFRYFFFDIAPSKLQRRPPSFDRTIALTIFVQYLGKRYPIPQGGILATITGFFLACGRAMVNGYALMFFDSFTFLYQVKNDKNGVPLDNNIAVLHNNEALSKLEKDINDSESETEKERLKKLQYEWQQTAVTNSLDVWDFPVRRYLKKPTYYFKNNEVGSLAIDDKYILEDEPDKKGDTITNKTNDDQTTEHDDSSKTVKLTDLL